jgi:hypothetical protein
MIRGRASFEGLRAVENNDSNLFPIGPNLVFFFT